MDEMECGCFFPSHEGGARVAREKVSTFHRVSQNTSFIALELDTPLYPTGGNKRVLSNSVWETRDSSAVLRLRKCLFLHSNFLSRILHKELNILLWILWIDGKKSQEFNLKPREKKLAAVQKGRSKRRGFLTPNAKQLRNHSLSHTSLCKTVSSTREKRFVFPQLVEETTILGPLGHRSRRSWGSPKKKR